MKFIDTRFACVEIKLLRAEAKRHGIKLPKKLTALKSSVGNWYLVEGEGFKKEVAAYSALDARIKVIQTILNEKIKK